MSNDLISRSALMDALRRNVLVDATPALEDTISAMPVAYDVDNIVEQLKKETSGLTSWAEDAAYRIGIEKAIKIIRAGGADENITNPI